MNRKLATIEEFKIALIDSCIPIINAKLNKIQLKKSLTFGIIVVIYSWNSHNPILINIGSLTINSLQRSHVTISIITSALSKLGQSLSSLPLPFRNHHSTTNKAARDNGLKSLLKQKK